jgi:hypothetical protein
MSAAKRLVRKFYGWLGYRLAQVPGIHRSRWLWTVSLWLLIQPWEKDKQRAFLWILRLPDDLRTDFFDLDKELAADILDGIVEGLGAMAKEAKELAAASSPGKPEIPRAA